MSKKLFLFGTIASVIAINSVFADTIVTSQSYVDNRDALKQDKIPVAETNIETPGVSVVTYTDTAGVIGERGILEPDQIYNRKKDSEKLITAGAVESVIPELPTGTADTVVMYNNNGDIGGERGIYDGSTTYNARTDANKLVTASVVTNQPTTTTTKKVCTEWVSGQSHTDANCLLWDLRNAPIRARQCYSSEDCEGYGYSCGGMCEDGICVNGIC